MNATARTARQIIKTRRAEAAAAKRPHTLKSHAIRAGLDTTLAGSVSGALRVKGKSCGVLGTPARMFRRTESGVKMWRQPVKNARRYTLAEFGQVVTAYNPRAERTVNARNLLLAYAG